MTMCFIFSRLNGRIFSNLYILIIILKLRSLTGNENGPSPFDRAWHSVGTESKIAEWNRDKSQAEYHGG